MSKNIYACVECGFETPKWMGRCTRCGSWDTLREVESQVSAASKAGRTVSDKLEISKLKDISDKVEGRLSTGFDEFDRVLGGGLVKDEVVLLGGEPGIGKTSLLLQVSNNIVKVGDRCLYVSAEESPSQLSVHFKRLKLKGDVEVISSDDIDAIIASVKSKKLSLLVIDSIQTVKTTEMRGLPGGIGQVKECTSRIVEFAKKTGVAVIVVGHITKTGDIAGPKMIEHLVDAVMYLEGETDTNVRFIKVVKNRYGAIGEVGVFTYEQEGYKDAKDLSEMFVKTKDARIGVSRGVIYEGRRAMVIEVQALVSKSSFSIPQRIVNGMNKTRIQMLSAVLSKYSRLNLADKDIYVNISGGLKVNDSALDLAICLAIISSYKKKKIDSKHIAIGEVSLTGQVTSPYQYKERLKTAKRISYKRIFLPFIGKISDKGRPAQRLIYIDSVSQISRYI